MSEKSQVSSAWFDHSDRSDRSDPVDNSRHDGFLELIPTEPTDPIRLKNETDHRLKQFFAERKLAFFDGQYQALQHINELVLRAPKNSVTAVPLVPGGGKSTYIRAFCNVLSEFISLMFNLWEWNVRVPFMKMVRQLSEKQSAYGLVPDGSFKEAGFEEEKLKKLRSLISSRVTECEAINVIDTILANKPGFFSYGKAISVNTPALKKFDKSSGFSTILFSGTAQLAPELTCSGASVVECPIRVGRKILIPRAAIDEFIGSAA